jgi:hypothetical protein
VQPFAVAILISAIFVVGAVSGNLDKAQTVRAQTSWRIYSPPDKSFTVQVPVTPHHDFESYEGLDESTPGGLKPIHAYVGFMGLENPRAYFISVFKDIAPQRGPGDMGIDELLNLLTRKSTLISSKEISVASGRARELTLVSKYTDHNEFTRVRFIRVGVRVYMLTYLTDTADDVYSRFATRFLNSFHAKR